MYRFGQTVCIRRATARLDGNRTHQKDEPLEGRKTQMRLFSFKAYNFRMEPQKLAPPGETFTVNCTHEDCGKQFTAGVREWQLNPDSKCPHCGKTLTLLIEGNEQNRRPSY